mmetsp:Transcript_24674/g.79790  ORF Transcript_24674/g.79790 Transcript_24674/m.79790 type:complete len:137 (-) Transcript_24674:543-953(-)
MLGRVLRRSLASAGASKKKVLFVGLEPSYVDFTKWPDLNEEKLTKGLQSAIDEIKAAGHDASPCWIDTGATAEATVIGELAKGYDAVLVGAGVRTDPEHFLLFEKLVNVVHEHTPDAKICLNSNPFDSLDAVIRVF